MPGVPRLLLALSLLASSTSSCAPDPTTNDKQREAQNTLLGNIAAQVGMPAVTNGTEAKNMKHIYEMRDQPHLVTYTYLFSEVTGKTTFFCTSIGFGLPYATQFTAPETMQRYYVPSTNGSGASYGTERLPQADPNGLFMPSSAEGTWVTCLNPQTKEESVVYVEPRVIVTPFKIEG